MEHSDDKTYMQSRLETIETTQNQEGCLPIRLRTRPTLNNKNSFNISRISTEPGTRQFTIARLIPPPTYYRSQWRRGIPDRRDIGLPPISSQAAVFGQMVRLRRTKFGTRQHHRPRQLIPNQQLSSPEPYKITIK